VAPLPRAGDRRKASRRAAFLGCLLCLAVPAGWLTSPATAAAAPAKSAPAKRPAVPAGAGSAPAGLSPAAARAIAIAEDERRWADGELRRYLGDRSPAVRARAALAVGRIQDSTSVSALLPLLGDAAPEVRREAVFALGQIGQRSARAALEARLADQDPATVELAVEALGKLADRAATPAVERFLADPAPARRRAAAVALWRLADSTALEPLIARHDDPDPGVRWRVLYALEKIVAPDRIALVAAQHLDDDDGLVRAYAARTIGRQKSPRAVAYLLQALQDPEVAVVVNTVRALQAIADTTCARCGGDLASLLSHPHPYVRATAATALADRFALAVADSARKAAVVESLVVHLRDPDAATRGACARALLAVRGKAEFETVMPLLADSSLYVRVAVMNALATVPSLPLGFLRNLVDPGRELLQRMTAAELLGAHPQAGGAALLRAGLADTSALFVSACAGALAALQDSASVPALAEAYVAHARDAEADARDSIRDALRDLGDRALADSLERAHPARRMPPVYPPDFGLPPAVHGAVLHTSKGDIEWTFFTAEAPQTVKNFVRLARRGYFNGTAIHRVVPNFVIQDGDPTGTGSGGPGYTIRCEYNRLHYVAGMVGMALSGKDTGGSQWFITHSPQPHLDGRYTIFARVTAGMDVVHRIVQGDRVLKVEVRE
jgi:cyclophilin family peptidyl-prolyl cis-trans isomerase/HEAT repeat protein